ncbi:hypothetical protein predicted by Glimmer/Critica [Salmonella enterica subsp. enterica serovar Weltevreden str. 2007-60-3289-1]|nr:hypothetical protein predicted by Glimmer/Critica [Salmonella enterica subsp. enterica serovar Weltevreden str. 2007-60-3289-1]
MSCVLFKKTANEPQVKINYLSVLFVFDEVKNFP